MPTLFPTVRERRARPVAEMRLLNELAEFLQACLTSEEAYSLVARPSALLFPGCGGAISITHPSRDLVESAGSWGDVPLGQAIFAPVDCWALRRGRPHLSIETGPRCGHLRDSNAAWCWCIPMVGQGEPIGAFHVMSAGRSGEEHGSEEGCFGVGVVGRGRRLARNGAEARALPCCGGG